MINNGNTLQNHNFSQHIKTFLEAYVDPRIEEYTRERQINDTLEMTRFLKILGDQKIQCILGLDDAFISFLFKTSKEKVEYLKVTKERENDSTIDLNVDLNWLSNPYDTNFVEKLHFLLSHNMKTKKNIE